MSKLFSGPLGWRDLFRLGPASDDHFIALRTGVGVFVPLITLVAIDRLDLAAFAVFGAFTGVYGRIPNHRRRLAHQLRSGALFWVVILLAGWTSRFLVDHATLTGTWVVVALTTFVAWGCQVIAGLWRLRPAGSLFHIFAFAAIASMPSLPPIFEAMLTTTLTVLLALVVGFCGWLLPSRRTPWHVEPDPPMGARERQAVWLESIGYLVAAGVSGAIATLLMPVLQTGHNYWAMVAAVVPLVGHTTRHRLARGLHRVLGTVVGIGIMAVIVVLDLSPWIVVLLIGVMQFGAELFIARNYFLGQVFVTPLALIGVGLMKGMGMNLIYDRVLETIIGAVVGMAVVVATTLIARRRTQDAAA